MHFLVQRLSVCLAAALVFASALGAEQSEASKTVTRLNNEILRVYSRSVRGGGDTSAVREQAKELLQQREAALAALVAESPSAALDAALPADVASDVARAFPESAARVERRGSLIGVLEIEVEDNEELTDHRLIHRLRVGRDRYRMRFSGDSPAAEAGSLMRVDGMLVGESIVAESASLTTEADAAASCSTTGVQRIAVIKVKFPGSNPTLPNASLDSWMFGSSGKTVSNYWDENSYGAAWADGDVYPAGTDAWYTLDREYTCAESDALRNAALQAANGNVNFQNYQRAVIVFPKPTSGCSFAGRASIGCWVSSPDGNTISYALQVLSSMGTQEKTVQLTTHEGGHTLGLYHASTVDYGADALGPTTSGGTRDEYGDRYSSMGFWTDGHYAAPQKKQLGWLNPTSVNSSGTFTVVPFSNTSGIRALDIKRGSTGTQRIWLEYRRQLGQFNEAPPAYPGNGALLHLGNGNSNSLLLDFTPSSAGGFLDATLESGQTWDDPYSDLVIKIGSATNSGLQVTVSYGTAAPCSANPPTISVSPSSKSTNYPTATSYTVTVTNNDTSACASSSYTMTSKALYNGGATSEVSTSVNNPVLTIAPGATGTTTLVATPSVQPPDARNYMVSAKAARSTPAQSAEDDAGLTVVPPLQCVTAAPVITLSPVSRTAQYPTGTTFTASLKNNDNSACSATSFTMSAFAQLGGQAAGNISTTVAPSLSVAPGATMTTTVTVTPTSAPSSQSTYSITARAARANPSQTVQASSTFTVTLAAATCQPKVPTVSLSPDSRNTEFPKQASFTLTVLNNDSSACTAGSFSISGTTTNLASTGVSASLLSIAPGASKTAIVTVTPTKSVTAPTNHTVTARVSRSSPSQLVQDTAILIVTPPAATCVRTLPSVTMTPTSGSTAYPNPLSYTVSLTNNDTAVCGTSTLALTTSALFGGLTTTEVTVTPSAVGLNVAPGATASTVVVATPRVLPSSSKSYAVKAAVTRTVQTGTAQKTASLTVTPPSIAPPSASTVDVVVSVIGSGGTVKIDPLGVSCPGGCTKKVNTSQWQPLTLTAIPSGNSCVQALIGCSSSSGNTCTLSTAKNYNVTVQFGRCTGVGGQSGGKTRVSRLPATADATSTGRGRKR